MDIEKDNYKKFNERKRTLVYWGTGNICRECLKWHPEIAPEIFLDNNKEKREFCDRKVFQPDEIKDWKAYFIVITVMAYEEVATYLLDRGLEPGTDFMHYAEFFCEDIRVNESYKNIAGWIAKNPEYKQSIFIYAPMFTCRQSTAMTNFFKEYIKARKTERSVVLSMLGIISEEHASKFMGAPVIAAPRLCLFDSPHIDENVEFNSYKNYEISLSQEESKWITDLENRKTSKDSVKTLFLTKVLYQYIRDIIKLLMPSKVIIWGGWNRLGYILAKVSQDMEIPYGYMEFGWLPGTYQFDYGGIAGQSIYATERRGLAKTIRNKDFAEIEQIKEYIRNEKIDTGQFRVSAFDEKQMQKIRSDRKTVFFVGMGDDGMQINPNSEYWEKYVSNIVCSTHEAAELLYTICNRNGWNFIFKPHPREDDFSGYDEWAKNADFILVREARIDELLEMSDVVVSISSAVEYKALIYEKALVEIGHGSIQNQGCTYIPGGRDEIEDNIKNAMKYGVTEEQRNAFNRHIKELLEIHLWHDMTQRTHRYGLNLARDFFEDAENIGGNSK